MDELFRRIDNTELPFVTDENLIGKWTYADFVKQIDEFMPNVQKWPGESIVNRMEFFENGAISTGDDELLSSALTWTNGRIISEPDKTCAAYEIREIDGEAYLFFEWKSGDYVYRMAEPWIYVFKKEETV